MSKNIKILLIEDDEDDVELLQDALTSNQVNFEMEILKDGGAAVEHIKTCTDCPDIIVMDLNLPKVHGRELLREIKSTSLYKNIPLLVLTTSSSKDDISTMMELGADNYLVKPSTVEDIHKTVSVIVDLGNSKN